MLVSRRRPAYNGRIVEREARDALIEAAQQQVDAALRDAFGSFARELLRSGALHRSAGEMASRRALDAFGFAQVRAADEIKIRVANPDDQPGRTVVQILQEDRPFLVDSLRMLFERRGLRERVFVHPVLPVGRSPDGVLEVVSAGPEVRHESLIHAEVVPRVEDPDRQAELEADLRRVMETVRDVTDDHRRMVRVVRELGANIEFASRLLEGGLERASKICRFLDWLVEDRFVFVGIRRYGLKRIEGDVEVWLVPDAGLGLWRDDSTSTLREPRRGEEIPDEVRAIVEDPRLVLIDKSRLESPIHRPGRLDRIVVAELDERGETTGFAILFGLFAFRALHTPASQVPLLAERLDQILAADGSPRGSHRYKATVAAFDSAPVEFLLGSDVEGIAELIREIVDSEGSNEASLVLRADRSGRSFYAAVLLPRERYGEDLRGRIRKLLEERTSASTIDDRTSFLEEDTAILHFFCTAARGSLELPDAHALEGQVRALCARWEDRLLEALREHFGEARAPALAALYETAFPEALRVCTNPADAVRDIEALEALAGTEKPQFALYFDRDDASCETATLKIFLREAPLLSDLLPVVDHFGIPVVDAQQATARPAERPSAIVETLRVRPLGGTQEDLDAVAPRLFEALRAVMLGDVPDDGLNGLVLGAGLDWKQTDCVRAYLEYFMQTQGTLTRPFVRGVLLENPLAVRLLVRLHEARFDPELSEPEREAREAWSSQAFEGYRDRIESLNEDRALAGLRALVDATLRTNFFAPAASPHRIAVKLDSSLVPGLAGPQPHREIFVHSRLMMGVHLRGGPVARGGLRWSDRADDLRLEVLGLMRTQMLKNGLIVPVGAKGGFVLKSSGLSPREARELADQQYRVFVGSLLDLTDNVAQEGLVTGPPGVLRRDGDDPYLVVAADKGTAHLSDAANEISRARDFWLGDAFASGGSEGYDHKKYGITARGAWECAKHHFAELDIDAERGEFTAAGIGDMSGDVFGNGLLLARRAMLLAAFDHRHVFLDPDPDPETSWAERKRLFELPGSTWADYDPTRLSPGGGVFPRHAKRIALSPRVRERLGITAAEASGNEVVKAILAMPVDLLWNGGIGTYVKAAHESHADVGDRANDAVRIDAGQLRARVVAEGGNLGLTQAARIEAARAGVKLDTDAIDNSAGVDLSDHEVNYKVLLAPLMRAERISAEERRTLLLQAAADACESVLSHNRGQALALSLDELRSQRDLEPFRRAIEFLCEPADVDPEELRLPDARKLARRAAAGQGLTRPELAVLLGLAKLRTRQALAASPLIESEVFAPSFAEYFPPAFRSGFPEALRAHRLWREITALTVSNRLLDFAGVTLVSSLATELGIDVPQVAAAAWAAENVLGIAEHRRRLLGLSSHVPRAPIYEALLEIDRGVRDVARFLVASRAHEPDFKRLERLQLGLAELRTHRAEFMSEGEARQASERRANLMAQGIPADLASDVSVLPLADRGLNVVRIAEEIPVAPLDAARVYARVGDATGINWVYQRLPSVQTPDPWDRILLGDLRAALLDLQRELTTRILTPRPADALAAAEAFLGQHAALLERVRQLQRRALTGEGPSALAVVVQRLRGLLASA